MIKSGVVEIRNLQTDKVWFFWADDIDKDSVKIRFKLDMGVHECASLQEDYTKTGLEVFRFSVVDFTEDKNRLAHFKQLTDNQYM